MDDKKDYKDTLIILNDTATAASLLNRLGKMGVGSEDTQLQTMVFVLSKIVRDTMVKSTAKIRLLSMPQSAASYGQIITNAAALAKYCQACVASAEPQWQILARRAGWTPPAKPESPINTGTQHAST